MPNSFSTNKVAGIIAKAAAGYLNDKVQFVKAISKADPSDFAGKNGYSAGDTININVPFIPTVGTSRDLTSSVQDIVETRRPLVLNNNASLGVQVSSNELATDFSIKSFLSRVVEPAMNSIAADIESKALIQAKNATANLVGSWGSTQVDTFTALQANQKITEGGCADYDNRFLLLSPSATVSAVNARKGLFQSSSEIAAQYKNGYMGQGDGFTYLTNNNLPNQVNGTHNLTGVTVSANLTNGSGSVALAGLGNTLTVTAGEVFTIAGCFEVHPLTKQSIGSLKQFVVTTGGTSSAGGALTVTVAPVIYGSAGAGLQNVSTLTVSGNAVAFVGVANDLTRRQSFAFHKNSFRFVSVPLEIPGGVDFAAQETMDGITVRMIRDYLPLTDQTFLRFDVLWGMANERPEWAARVTE